MAKGDYVVGISESFYELDTPEKTKMAIEHTVKNFESRLQDIVRSRQPVGSFTVDFQITTSQVK